MTKKKSVKKKTTRKKPSSKKNSSKSTNKKNQALEKILIDNFVSLQKVMTNLSKRFDELSGQISKLLELFEISAKSLAEKEVSIKEDTKDQEEIKKKIDEIFKQNKIIAKGLTLLHEKEEEIYSPDEDFYSDIPPMQQNLQNMPSQTPPHPSSNMPPQLPHPQRQQAPRFGPQQNKGQYQKSISSSENEERQ